MKNIRKNNDAIARVLENKWILINKGLKVGTFVMAIGLTALVSGNKTVNQNDMVQSSAVYQAADSSLWPNEKAYNDYINSVDKTKKVIDDEKEIYQAPDGSYWASEKEYKDYSSSLDENSKSNPVR